LPETVTQTVWEARLLTKAARKYKVPTQMGNQGYSSEATRVACEIIWRATSATSPSPFMERRWLCARHQGVAGG